MLQARRRDRVAKLRLRRKSADVSGYHTHTLDIYGTDLHLATTKAGWRRLAKRVKGATSKTPPEDLGSSTFATRHPANGGPVRPTLILWVHATRHDTTAGLVDTIAHEAAHAASHLMEYVGHDNRGTDEPSAYLTGWLAGWMWDRIRGAAQ
jgi:hypothetical protein